MKIYAEDGSQVIVLWPTPSLVSCGSIPAGKEKLSYHPPCSFSCMELRCGLCKETHPKGLLHERRQNLAWYVFSEEHML